MSSSKFCYVSWKCMARRSFSEVAWSCVLCRSIFFNIKKGLRLYFKRGVFIVNFAKFLRTAFLQNIPGRLVSCVRNFVANEDIRMSGILTWMYHRIRFQESFCYFILLNKENIFWIDYFWPLIFWGFFSLLELFLFQAQIESI